MGPVAEELARELDGAEFRDAKMPVILNVTGMQAVSAEEIRAALKRQLMSRVHWLQSVQEMIGMGIGVFIEAGPGTALSGMVRKISKDVEVSNFQDMKSLEKLKETLFAFSGGKEA
jgi:[acyl-carrier-protein] S-malonyltransferase